MQFIRRNFTLKATAVAIAVVLWFTFNHFGATQPIYSKTLELPLGVHGVESGFVPSVPVKTVAVEFTGPRSQLDQLTPGQFSASVDCSGKREGLYALPVAIVGKGSNEVRSISPGQVVVTIDRYSYRSVPVVAGTTPAGRPPQVTFDPKTVTVAGAQSLVVQVMAASVAIPPAAAWKNGAADAKPTAVDSKLVAVGGVTVAPPYVRLSSLGKKPAAKQ